MGIVNKRNAILGWVTWKLGKGLAKKKAKRAMPHKPDQGTKRKPALLAGIAAALGSVAWSLRKRKRGSGQPD